ncbi:MAG: hypothetical protein M1838_004968 [Thelocarpon superellum]|nr:MAG: hypothetical protein M1838_004968 [Thelocarpon superellum]
MARSLKEVVKILTNLLTQPTPPYPLPADVQETVQAYLDKHLPTPELESQRIQDELLHIYHTIVIGDDAKHPPFLACLRLLGPAIHGTERLLEWWTILLRPTLESLSQHKGVVEDARDILLAILVFDDEDDVDGDRARASSVFTDKLLEVYLEKTRVHAVEEEEALLEDDQGAALIAHHLESLFVAFGRKRPKSLMIALDALTVQKEHRIQALSLLCTFVRHQPPHLYEVLKTPLLDHLLKCLMMDTSTLVISLALTTLVMFLPHVPSSLVPYLPRLFAIYSRILCWEKHGPARPDGVAVEDATDADAEGDGDPTTNGGPVMSHMYSDPSWDALYHALDSIDTDAPDLSHYFTFLYGLYPLNFMSFIRKPVKYLREARLPGGDEIKPDQATMQHRTEQFRQGHLLHVNFYTMTVDSELTDTSRFLESEPADVVAECMGLCAAVPMNLGEPGPPPSGKLPVIPESNMATEDIPPQTLLAADDGGSTLINGDDAQSQPRAINGWRNTQSTLGSLTSSDGGSRLPRRPSQNGQARLMARSNGPHSRYSSPVSTPHDNPEDSPTLPAHFAQSPSETNLRDMLQAQESLRGSFHQSHGNDSDHSLPILETASPRLDAYLQSLSQTPATRSPAMTLKTAGAVTNVAFLQREILLLKNDLNFERYLKHQHLSHIGQLQRKYIREATIEAETQKLINNNRTLKYKQEEAKKTLAMLRKEMMASKNHAKRWEGELHVKSRALREEQKRWRAEEDSLRRELRDAQQECDHLRRLVIESEARELLSRQRMQSVETNLDELERLRIEVEGLNGRLQEYESREEEFAFGKQNEEIARTQLESLRMKLKTRDADRDRMKRGYEQKVTELESRLQAAPTPPHAPTPQAVQSMLDSALAASQARFAQLRKIYNHLLSRYAELEMRYMDLQASDERDGSYNHSNPGHSHGADEFDFFGEVDGQDGRIQLATSDPSVSHDGFKAGFNAMSPIEPTSSSFPNHLSPLDLFNGVPSNGNGAVNGIGNGVLVNGNGIVNGADRVGPFDTPLASLRQQNNSDGSDKSVSHSANTKAKIKPTSEVRIYGRGGVQNIGKKEKAGKGKEKENPKDKKPLKPGAALKGIRGFV